METPFSTTIKDSGARTEFATGSLRDKRVGKGRFDLLPILALVRLAKHFEGGAVKYGDRNWEKGQPLSCYMDSALRHAFKYLLGLRDEDHLTAASWNLMCLAETETKISLGLLPKELNNLPEAFPPEVATAILDLLEPKEPLKFTPKKDADLQIPCGHAPPVICKNEKSMSQDSSQLTIPNL